MDEARALDCPHCGGGSLRRTTQQRGFLYDCGGCGGKFVEHAVLVELLERHAPPGDIVLKPRARSNPLEQKVCYRPCAICRELMNRKNFGGESGVIVDVCPSHGMWFDSGELAGVLSFVAQGGLARARRQDRARHEPTAQTSYAPTRAISWAAPDPGIEGTSLADYGEGVIELVEFLHDVLSSAYPSGQK